jgi:hypothetical protein
MLLAVAVRCRESLPGHQPGVEIYRYWLMTVGCNQCRASRVQCNNTPLNNAVAKDAPRCLESPGTKKPPSGGSLICQNLNDSGYKCFNALVESALVPCRLVTGNDAFVDHAIDHRDSIFIRCYRSIAVAGITGIDDFLDFGAHQRAQAHILLAGFLRLAGALSG